MNLFFVLSYLLLVRLVCAKLAVKISKKNTNLTSSTNGPMQIFMQYKDAYPEPLPSDPPRKIVMSPYTTLYQGLRYKDDTRVFRKTFDYGVMLKGQQITCHGIFDCVISHIAIESSEAIPVLLRGGAGYRHFTAVVKSKPHRNLKGQVRVYCRNNYVPSEESEKSAKRRFNFGDRVAEENWM